LYDEPFLRIISVICVSCTVGVIYNWPRSKLNLSNLTEISMKWQHIWVDRYDLIVCLFYVLYAKNVWGYIQKFLDWADNKI
jgi:hypothetical protein